MSNNKTTEQRLTDIIVSQLNCSPGQITRATSFQQDLGADSLDQVELMMAIEEEFKTELGSPIPVGDEEKLTTVGAVADYIEARAGRRE